MNSIATSGRRSSIWDEIDASLEKKLTNRMSVFSVPAPPSEYGDIPPPLPTADPLGSYPPNARHNSVRNSRLYGSVRRMSVSIMSHMGANNSEPEADEAAILRRRHRYIQRQLRYLLLYPILYLLLWLCPFILHCLQYNDYFAAHPPFVLIVMAFTSTTLFGFMNSLVFCLREKPWTMIADSDGTFGGSFVWCPKVVKTVCRKVLGCSWSRDEDEEVWG